MIYISENNTLSSLRKRTASLKCESKSTPQKAVRKSYARKPVKQTFDCDKFNLRQMDKFLRMTEEDYYIQRFLQHDQCNKNADKYLLAIVFVYFVRAKLSLLEYNCDNFFRALCLAHDIEEDDDPFKEDVVNWGSYKLVWRQRQFLKERNQFWARMDYRAIVSIQTCQKVMNSRPDSPLWQRERSIAHVSYESEVECPKCKKGEENTFFLIERDSKSGKFCIE